MGVLLVLAIGVVLLYLVRDEYINNSIAEHEQIMRDAEYEKY